IPLHGHVFFKYFIPLNEITAHKPMFDFVMDFLLLFVLSGVTLAWIKRMRSRAMGMKKTTQHISFDRIALTALWFVFPVRLLCESVTSAIYGGGSFLTGGIGSLLAAGINTEILHAIYEPLWWLYSCALGIFFVAMPFSRYMHIFTEIPLIFLRHFRLRPEAKEKSYDNFEVEACSRCGICIDPCQLQMQLGINDVQSVYFLRDRRKNRLQQKIANNCLMCGRCEQICPVGINLNTLRLNSRTSMRNIPNESRYKYLKNLDRSSGEGRVGYFAGCMTLLTPNTLSAMQHIFDAAREDVWWADKNGGVCCGRPLKLSGESDSAQKMIDYNKSLFYKHNITTLVTSCPICLRIFNEEYKLDGIEVLHHSEYILRLIEQGRLHVNYSTEHTFTYHDPCELGRGSGIYNEPRAVIEAIGTLLEPSHSRKNALCCGSSLANTAINDSQQLTIARNVAEDLDNTGAETIVTACPLCKKAIARGATHQVKDLSEIVAANIL
ncbi:MAG: (Fe-S)-binding protein, partial [Alistipes sp.]|nr:(Fe-S)-binding protein [Alistipes sp.]